MVLKKYGKIVGEKKYGKKVRKTNTGKKSSGHVTDVPSGYVTSGNVTSGQ